MKNDDAKLIQRVLAGDDTAFSALVKKHQKPVHALAWRKTGDFHVAEEITQDTFLKAYQNLSTLKEPQKFSGWLYVIAANYCKMWMRKKRLSTQSLEDTNSAELERANYSGYVIAENERITVEARREVVKKLLAKLQESDRIVITLYYLAGMTYEEISAFLGVSVSAIKNRLYRARQRLKKEEPMIREALGNFQITPSLTETIMGEISRLKPVAPSGSKPLVPWVLAASTLAVVLMLGVGSQYLSRFQKPYSFDAASEMTVELIEAPIVLNLESKPDVRRQLGNVNAPSKSDTANQQPNGVSASVADAESEETDKDYNRWQLPEDAKLRLGKGSLHDIKFTPDGNRVAVATGIGIWIYDAQTGQEISLLTGHTDWVTSLGFPADGRFLASGSFDGTVRLWDIETGKQIALFAGHWHGIKAIAVSPDGKTVVSGGGLEGWLIFWDTETGEQIKRHTRYTDNLIHTFKIFLDRSRTLTSPNAIEGLAFSLDGKTFASGHSDGIIRLWDAGTGRKLSLIKADKHASMWSLALSPDGKTLARNLPNASVLLHTLQNGKSVSHRPVHHAHFPRNLIFSPDGTTLIGTGGYYEKDRDLYEEWDIHIHVWDVDTGALLRSFPTHGKRKRVEALAVSPDGGTILAGGWDDAIHSWDAATGKRSNFTSGHTRFRGRMLLFSDNAQTLTNWENHDHIQSWNIDTGTQLTAPQDIKQIRNQADHQLMHSPDGKTFLEFNSDWKNIRLRDVATGHRISDITRHKDIISSWAFSPDSKILASASRDMTIQLSEVTTGKQILTFETHTNATAAVAFSPDGKILVGGSVYDSQLGRSDLIRLWELPSGRVLTTLIGRTSRVDALRFSPDGKTLASSGDDGTILLWEMDKIVREE